VKRNVGLPLTAVVANSGFEAIALDTSRGNVPRIKSGILPFTEGNAQNWLTKTISDKRLQSTIEHMKILGKTFTGQPAGAMGKKDFE
jgi:UDP-N-acetyl-D-mannosaminuronate dehydrogenase